MLICVANALRPLCAHSNIFFTQHIMLATAYA